MGLRSMVVAFAMAMGVASAAVAQEGQESPAPTTDLSFLDAVKSDSAQPPASEVEGQPASPSSSPEVAGMPIDPAQQSAAAPAAEQPASESAPETAAPLADATAQPAAAESAATAPEPPKVAELDVIPLPQKEAPLPPAQREAPRSMAIEEIVVTAQKRSENLQDVPIAVSAFTAETRQVIGADNMQDFTKFTPGLTYSGSDDRVFVRGVGRQTNTAGTDPGVATYADGLYDSSTVNVGGSDFFVERVEVLRGPQGTLYGRNSLGGAINAISKRPTQEWTGESRFVLGTYDAYSVSAAVSGPLSDWFRIRVAGTQGVQKEGYYTNVAGGPSEGGVADGGIYEVQFDADLSENVNAWLRLFTGGAETRPRGDNLVDPYDYAAFPYGFITPGAAYGYNTPGYTQEGSTTTNPALRDPWKINVDTPSKGKISDWYGVINHVRWSLDSFDIKFIGGIRGYLYESIKDLDMTSVTSYNYPPGANEGLPADVCNVEQACLKAYPTTTFGYLEDRTYGSAEINFSSNSDGALRWITGLYYYSEDMHQEAHFTAADQPELKNPIYAPSQSDPTGAPSGMAPPNPSGDFVTVDTYMDAASYAGFGQIDLDLTDALTMTLGLRYSMDEKDVNEGLRVVCLGCVLPQALVPGTPGTDVTAYAVSTAPAPGVVSPVVYGTDGLARRKLKGDWSATTGTLGFQWRPMGADDLMTYFSFSRGYKSGGFNGGGVTGRPGTDPEYVNAYETGLKFSSGASLVTNVSLFYNDYEGLQAPLVVAQGTDLFTLTEFANLDSAYSYGFELETTWQVSELLRLMISYAYSDSEINSCCYVDDADPTAVQPGAQPVGQPADGKQPQSLDGNELPQLPRHKVGINLSHMLPFSTGTFISSLSYSWRDTSYSKVFQRDYYQAPAYDQVDLRFLWTTYDERYRFIFGIKNLFDTLGYDSVTTVVPYVEQPENGQSVGRALGLTPPRQLGATLEIRFK